MGFDRSNPRENHYKAKLIMRSLALFFGFIAIIMGGYSWIFSLGLLVPLCISFIWNLANVIRRLTAASPMHPGANVGMDLIVWMAMFIMVVWTFLIAGAGSIVTSETFWNNQRLGTTYSSDSSVCVVNGNNDSTSGACAPVSQDQLDRVHKLARASLGSTAFGTILVLLHFILFVVACVDTHRRRKGTYKNIDDQAYTHPQPNFEQVQPQMQQQRFN